MKFEDIIDVSQIALDVEATDKFDAIIKLAALFEGKDIITDFDGYYKAVLQREDEFATAIGMEVAIPHGKTDIVKRSSVAFGRLKRPILWDAKDNEWVRMIFLLAVPDTNGENSHLTILSSLARGLIHEENREAFLKAKTPEDVMNVFMNIPIIKRK